MDPEVRNFIRHNRILVSLPLFKIRKQKKRYRSSFLNPVKSVWNPWDFPLHMFVHWQHFNSQQPLRQEQNLGAVNFHALWLVGPPPSQPASAVHMFLGAWARRDTRCGPADATTADFDSWEATGCEELGFSLAEEQESQVPLPTSIGKLFQVAVTENLVIMGAGHL